MSGGQLFQTVLHIISDNLSFSTNVVIIYHNIGAKAELAESSKLCCISSRISVLEKCTQGRMDSAI